MTHSHTAHLFGSGGLDMIDILALARDISPAESLNRVGSELLRAGSGFRGIFRTALAIPPETFFHNRPNVVFLGMSSSPELASDELALGREAIKEHIPIALFADLPASIGRPWFQEFREEIRLVFVVNIQGAERTQRFFPNAKISISGNPRWAEFFTPRFSRVEVRAKLGISPDATLILIPGGKDFIINTHHFLGVIKAITQLTHPVTPVIALHPGDPNRAPDYEKILDAHIKIIFADCEELGMNGDDLVAGSDVVVPSASTMAIAASCQRIPVVNFFTDLALERLEHMSGERTWQPVEDGAELAVYNDSHELAALLEKIIKGDMSLRKRQEELYPKPEHGSSEVIARELLKLAHKPR